MVRRTVMKNPLYKRLPRELKRNAGKNTALFLFLLLTIGFCSGYFIATGSLSARLAENYDRFITEDGHFTLSAPIDDGMKKIISDNDSAVSELLYKEKTLENGHLMRIYKVRDEVNLPETYSGELPRNDDEISIDRLYAKNNNISVGDNIVIEGRSFHVTGFSVIPDYTSLYKKNTDFMFNALDFCVALVTDKAFEEFNASGLNYNYAWTYNDRSLNEQEKHDKSEKIMNALAGYSENAIEEIKKKIALSPQNAEKYMAEADSVPVLTDYIPSDANSAINMATEDVGGDKNIVMWLLYITVAVIALAAAITAKSTVEQEASVIGTLRASGYRREELVGHYMISTIIITFIAAVLGNVIGYTFMNGVCASMYYGSYSFPVYTPHINAEAFVLTTFVPVAIVLLVELAVLMKLLSLPPLQFLRRELKRKKKGRSLPLKFGSFRTRFRLRVILRNYQAYIVLFAGILFADLLLMFSLMWTPLLDSFRDTVVDNIIAENQYILKAPADTSETTAEKFAVYTLKNDNGEDITIYGITENSQYVKNVDLSDDRFYFSSAFTDKYSISDGASVHFHEKYSGKEYTFVNAESYDYPPALCVFTGIDNFRTVFGTDPDYYTGYFCNNKITDIDEMYIATVIGRNDLTAAADQLENSVGFVKLFAVFAIAIYILMIYILSKMITERNARSVSVLKILGYNSTEISGLYQASTGIVVLLSMLISMPLNAVLIKVLYYVMMQRYNGWMSFHIDPWLYPEMLAVGTLCFLFTYLIECRRVRRTAMNEAIKDIE